MAAPADGGSLVAVWNVHPVCPRNRSTGHCIVGRRIRVGVRNLLDGLSILSARASALNYAADIISRAAGSRFMVGLPLLLWFSAALEHVRFDIVNSILRASLCNFD